MSAIAFLQTSPLAGSRKERRLLRSHIALRTTLPNQSRYCLPVGVRSTSFRFSQDADGLLPIQLLNVQNSSAARPIEAGSVSTHAIAKLRIVDHCRPDLFAHIVPATPDERTCVVLTGNP